MTAGETFAAAFDAFSRLAPVPAPIQAVRQQAFDRFAALGFPTTKNEDWHYTSVAPIAESEFTPLAEPSGDVRAEQLAHFRFGSTDWPTVVCVNGRFSPELSTLGNLPAGVSIDNAGKLWSGRYPLNVKVDGEIGDSGDAFRALNMAFMYDAIWMEIAPDAVIETPIHIMWVVDAVAAKGMMHPMVSIKAGHNSTSTVVESFVSLTDARYFTNAITDITVEPGATFHHCKVQREGLRAFHVGTIAVEQARDSHFHSFSFATGAELSRTNVHTRLDGEGSGATLNGLYMIDGAQTCDHQTQVIHAQPNTYSRELYKGILDGQSHGVFNGKVYVHPIAQKTDGKQTNNTLLLSDKAHVDTKPQLEIFADDVKCTHGATIGQIDRTALFYMKSRGIGHEKALPLLTYAFAADAIETLAIPELRDDLERQTLERFVTLDGHVE
jgi:Fe-S cluster assembly protein SufD